MTSQYFDPSNLCLWGSEVLNPLQSGPECTLGDLRLLKSQRNVMGQSTDMSPLLSIMHFWTFQNPLKFFMKVFNILVCYRLTHLKLGNATKPYFSAVLCTKTCYLRHQRWWTFRFFRWSNGAIENHQSFYKASASSWWPLKTNCVGVSYSPEH